MRIHMKSPASAEVLCSRLLLVRIVSKATKMDVHVVLFAGSSLIVGVGYCSCPHVILLCGRWPALLWLPEVTYIRRDGFLLLNNCHE